MSAPVFQKLWRAGVFTEKKLSAQLNQLSAQKSAGPQVNKLVSVQLAVKKKSWVKNFLKILVSSFCREFNMPSGFHHLTAVDICQPTLRLLICLMMNFSILINRKCQNCFFKTMKKNILHKIGQIPKLQTPKVFDFFDKII